MKLRRLRRYRVSESNVDLKTQPGVAQPDRKLNTLARTVLALADVVKLECRQEANYAMWDPFRSLDQTSVCREFRFRRRIETPAGTVEQTPVVQQIQVFTGYSVRIQVARSQYP